MRTKGQGGAGGNGWTTAGEEIKCDRRPVEIKADSAARRIELYVATFRGVGDWDHHGDRFERGAWDVSLATDLPAKLVKGFLDHTWPIGVPDKVFVDDKGLFMSIPLISSKDADNALEWCSTGVCSHGSVGYSTRASYWEDSRGQKTDAWSTGAGRVITQARLYEGSPVIWPADDDTSVVAIKSRQGFAGALHHKMRSFGAVVEEMQAHRELVAEEKELAARVIATLDEWKSALGGSGVPDPKVVDPGLVAAFKAYTAEMASVARR